MGLIQSHPEFFKLPSCDKSALTAELTKIFGNDYRKLLEDSLITHVFLYRTSHDAQSVQKATRTPENFHPFVLLVTDRGVFLSLEKHENEIYIGKCDNRVFLVDGRVNSDVPHATPAYIVVEDKSTSKLVDFIENLSAAQYWVSKCQMFAKLVFMELAQSQHNDFFKMTSDCKVAEKLFGSSKHIHDLEKASVTHVAVFKTPLEGIYRKSNESLREAIGRQWTSVDYHAFVVMTTSFGICLSFEKQQDGIYIGRSPWYENLVYYMENSPRKSPVDLVLEDDSDYSLSRLMVLIEDEKSGYSATDDNCQHFAKRIFDKVALNKTWEFTRPYKFFCMLIALFFLTVILFNGGPYVFFTLLCWMQSFVHCVAYLIYLLFGFCCNAIEYLFYLFKLILGLSILLVVVHHLGLHYLRIHVFNDRLIRGMERCFYLAILCMFLYTWVKKVL